jgi:hypothetical protein
VSLEALVMLDLARQWGLSEEPDEGPEGAIETMLSRLEGSHRAWGEFHTITFGQRAVRRDCVRDCVHCGGAEFS